MMKKTVSSLRLPAAAALLGLALMAMPVHAQTPTSAPSSADQTTQTDQSEEDWRNSRKKSETSDVFEDIINRRSSGTGFGMGRENPLESLPEESRRHLMKERAKVIATSDPNQPVSAPYTPSAEAQGDSDLQEQEKAAWEKIVSDMNGGSGQGQNQGQGQGQSQGQNPSGGQSQGQGQSQSGQQGQGSSDQRANDARSNSPLRGGSSASVSDILARIKGTQTGTGNPQGQAGTKSQGQSQSQDQGQSSSQSQSTPQNASQNISQSSSQDGEQSSASPQDSAGQDAAEAATNTAQDQAQSSSQSADQSSSQSDANPQEENITSPLDRIQSRQRETSSVTSGERTSASDYLKKSD